MKNMNTSYLSWHSTLLEIGQSPKLCILSLIPFSCCVIQGLAVEKATLKEFWPHCLIGVLIGCGSAYNRGLIRERYHIQGDVINDFCLSLLFCFAVSQEYREVEFREERMNRIGKRNLRD